jgi:5'-nucleotidase
VNWATAEAYGPKIIRQLIDFGFPPGILYNINFPDVSPDEVKGIEVSHQGRLLHSLYIDERIDPRGNKYFWLGYRRQRSERVPGTDLFSVDNGSVSITPLRLDLTDYELADRLRSSIAKTPLGKADATGG